MEKVYRAGTLPYVIKNHVPMFIFQIPSDQRYGGPDPQFSKGKIEDGEDEATAAIREAQEELGLRIDNVKWDTFFEMGVYLGRTTLYMFELFDQEDFGPFDFETKETVWMTNEQFQFDGRDLHRPIIQEAHDIIMADR